MTHNPERTAEVDVYCPYGPNVPGARVRIFEWIRRSQLTVRLHDYGGVADHQPKTLLRSPSELIKAEARLRFRHSNTARALIYREVSPLSGGALERAVARQTHWSIYDFDDALMHLPRTGVRRLRSKARSCRTAVENVDRVLAGSQFLAEWASQYNDDVWYMPTCVEPADYPAKSTYEIPDAPRLVWLGSKSTETYLRDIGTSLWRVHEQTGATLTVIGAAAHNAEEIGPFVQRVNWRPGIESTLSDYDIGLSPLRDGLFERGKCAYKLLQYGAAGLPSVASAVGANATVASDFGCMSVRSPAEWVDAILDVVSASVSLRMELGERARSVTIEKYSYGAWLKRWLSSFEPR